MDQVSMAGLLMFQQARYLKVPAPVAVSVMGQEVQTDVTAVQPSTIECQKRPK